MRSVRPTSSSTVRTPSFAIISRNSSAMKVMKFMTYSGLPQKRLLQLGVLCRDSDRAGVEVADSHHDAAHLSPAARSRSRIPPRRECRRWRRHGRSSACRPSRDVLSCAEPVLYQRLVRLGKAELPRKTGVVNRALRSRARAAVVAGDQDDLRARLGDARGDRSDARL